MADRPGRRVAPAFPAALLASLLATVAGGIGDADRETAREVKLGHEERSDDVRRPFDAGPPTDADRWEAEARDEWRQVSARGLKVWMEAFGSPTLIEDRLSDSTRQP